MFVSFRVFFTDIQDKNDDTSIVEKFESANLREEFEYAFKMFSKALDEILPRKEAEPYKKGFKYLSEKRMLVRNSYESPGHSLKLDGKKVQDLIDEYVRSTNIEGVMEQREVTAGMVLLSQSAS